MLAFHESLSHIKPSWQFAGLPFPCYHIWHGSERHIFLRSATERPRAARSVLLTHKKYLGEISPIAIRNMPITCFVMEDDLWHP